MGWDRDDFSQSREMRLENIKPPENWRQRMVRLEQERKEFEARLSKADPTKFLKESNFKINRRF